MKYRLAFLVLFIGFVSPRLSSAIVVGQIDSFQDGTLANWAVGSPDGPQPTIVPDGGPGGLGDQFMRIASTGGSGPGSRLTVFNRDQWLGDYIAASVTAIEIDLRNMGSVQLSIRLAFKPNTDFGAPGYLTTAFILPADGNWYHATFLIAPGSVIAVGSPAPFNTFFMNVGEFRIINEIGTGNLNGDVIAAQLGIDNIRAVPEPASWLLLGLAAIPFALVLRRRRA
ncbi:MAG: PEP-CTERM sorting domain-containing protein [Verrucomicrobiota bacterium]